MSEPPGEPDHPAIDDSDGPPRRRTLYPFVEPESDSVLEVVSSIASGMETELLISEVDVGSDDRSYKASRDVSEMVLRARNSTDIVDVRGQSLTGPTLLDAVVSAASTYDINLIVLGAGTPERLEARVAKRTGCDSVVVNEATRLESIASILVPISGGPHSAGAVDVGGALARTNDASVDLVHVLTDDESSKSRSEAESLLESGETQFPEAVDVNRRLLESQSVVDRIIEESDYHDVTVIGAPQKGRLRRLIFGSTATEIRKQASNTVVMARKGSDPSRSLFADSIGN